jgi:transposase
MLGTVPGRWTSVTLISALRLSGVFTPLAFEGATDTAAFRTYVEQALTPQLHPGDVVIWDNLKPHKDARVRQAIARAGAELVPLPPYSSDLTPIEELWSKARRSSGRSRPGLPTRCTTRWGPPYGRSVPRTS